MLRLRRPPVRPALLVAACLVAGCDDGVGKRLPVEGRVLVDGQPLRGASGTVVFVPDREKGNPCPVSPTGTIDAEGHYKLTTKGQPGAPAGPYVVTVSALPPGTGDREVVKQQQQLHHPKYAAEKTTPLKVEVTASPEAGAYDLKVTRK
jgi:hypothetical protein